MKKFSKILSVCLTLALMLSLATVAMADADPVGSESNPDIATNDYGPYEMGHYFEEAGTYYFALEADLTGLLFLENIEIYDADAADVTISVYNEYSNALVEVSNQKSASTLTVWEQDTVLVGIEAPAGADVFIVAYIVEYDEYLTVPGYSVTANDYTFYLYVNPGESITVGPAAGRGTANWSGMGMKVEGIFEPDSMVNTDPIPQTVVTVDGTQYKDLKGDSNIQMTMPNAPFGAPEFTISYNSMGWSYATYKITFVSEALTECDHTSKTPVGATAPGCHTDGVLAHEVCNDCGSFFIDGTMVASVVDPAANELIEIWRTVTCTEAGNITHWHCDACGKNYDYDLETDTYTELDTIASDALGHDMESNEAQAPTCHSDGNYEWHFCNNCYGYFKDADGNEAYEDYADIWLEADPDAHMWVLAEEDEDGEELVGNVPAAHASTELIYVCECPTCWIENDMVNHTTIQTTEPSCGTPVLVPAVAATTAAPGNIEHYACPECGKLFLDAKGEKEVSAADVVIAKLTPETPETPDKSPVTGESAATTVFALVMALIAASGCIVLMAKKKSC